MAKFAAPVRQAASVMKELQGDTLRSIGTVRNYEQALTRVAEFLQSNKLDDLRSLTPEKAVAYLEIRGQEVGQKSLDMERQAIQSMMQNVTNKLASTEKLPVVKSEQSQILSSRAYTVDQVKIITAAQAEKNAFSTQIAYAAGLRAHELLTIARSNEQAPDARPALDTKFEGRDGVIYTVTGKGGLTRNVLLPASLAIQLENRRLGEVRTAVDRGVFYQQRYDLNGGNRWSSSFSTASQRALGWSAGAHGVRHSYAQERMSELQKSGMTRDAALETVSQEMGHFRPEITETYLR